MASLDGKCVSIGETSSGLSVGYACGVSLVQVVVGLVDDGYTRHNMRGHSRPGRPGYAGS